MTAPIKLPLTELPTSLAGVVALLATLAPPNQRKVGALIVALAREGKLSRA